ncbi:MAG: C39 family peptidase [Patescibacteria group bacterium]
MKKIIFFFLVFFLAGCQQPEMVDVDVNPEETPDVVSSTTEPVEEPGENKVPSKLELKVLFAPQAPFANWDALHEEACEEASMIMADRYFGGKPLDESIMEAEIQDLVKWEEDNNYQVDLTVQETADVLKAYFNLTARITSEVTTDRIKYELAKGNLVLVPAAGRELKNPNYKAPGPIYHMLVIKGYDSDELITNDPGTKKGNGFRYGYDVFLNAVHDWNHALAQDGMTDAEMLSGRKVMIIVEKGS